MPKMNSFGPKQSTKTLAPLLKAVDISKPTTFTITAVEARLMKGETKPIATLKETDKQWVINATNIQALAERYGDIDLQDLVGKQVLLASVPTTFEGKPTKGIRVVG